MSRIVALDTETTGLDPDAEDVFEIAVVELATGAEHVWRVPPRGSVVDQMHPKAAEVNRYHERTSDPDWAWDRIDDTAVDVARTLEGAHIVGAVPDFDTRHLTSFFRQVGYRCPRWHYHLIDIEAMAVGFLYGHARGWTEGNSDGLTEEPSPLLADLPWRSDDLSRACGVEPPSDDERHTALGDARWVARWYRALTGKVGS